jgi:hypothetical protein
MKNILVLAIVALGLTSCIDKGDFVYVRSAEGPTNFGYVVGMNPDSLIFVKLCDGTVISASSGYMAEAPDGEVCP